jgi:phosphatidate cytidylyltransferase
LITLNWLVFPLHLLFFNFISELYHQKSDPFKEIGYTLVGLIWIGIPVCIAPMMVMHSGKFHPELLAGCFYAVWANDTGAYLVGRAFGKTKLFERISPKKTWEGAAGGMLFALLVALATAHFYPVISKMDWLIIGAIAVFAGNFGDLIESLLDL